MADFIEREKLQGLGCGWGLAACAASPAGTHFDDLDRDDFGQSRYFSPDV
jgi:hypothetical protein